MSVGSFEVTAQRKLPGPSVRSGQKRSLEGEDVGKLSPPPVRHRVGESPTPPAPGSVRTFRGVILYSLDSEGQCTGKTLAARGGPAHVFDQPAEAGSQTPTEPYYPSSDEERSEVITESEK